MYVCMYSSILRIHSASSLLLQRPSSSVALPPPSHKSWSVISKWLAKGAGPHAVPQEVVTRNPISVTVADAAAFLLVRCRNSFWAVMRACRG